ncbi:MAG: UDP-glucose dehydrogenase family protein [Acidimicrobiia bacterium]
MSSIAVVGAGYVGLTTAACLAHLGHDVACADVDAEKVRRLSKGEIPILEEGLPALVAEGLEARRLNFVVGAATAAEDAEFVFLCVPTPQGDDGAADVSVVEDVVREIASVLQPGTVVVNKSTMPVGSTRLVEQILGEAGAAVDEVGVASNPEFLREGTAVRDFLHPSRVVIGCEDTAVAVRVSDLYSNVHAPILVTDPASAEMIKYASNAFLATKISFINAVANLCEAVNADVREVALGMGYDPRIGFEFLHPGPGYGGSCFPKDTAALLHTAGSAGYDFSLLRGVVEVNRRQHERVVTKIRDAAGGALAGVTIGLWGLTFKANTDDLRDSPALAVAASLIDQGARLQVYDPAAAEEAGRRLPALDVVADPYEACRGARVVAVLTEWDEFRWLDFERVAETMEQPAVVDARNLLDPLAMRRRGFAYQGVGR